MSGEYTIQWETDSPGENLLCVSSTAINHGASAQSSQTASTQPATQAND